MRKKSSFNRKVGQELTRHKLAYAILLLLLITISVFFYFSPYNQFNQRIAIITLGVGYFFWGVITHLSSNHLTASLVFEYAAVSILACVSLIALTV